MSNLNGTAVLQYLWVHFVLG